MPEVIFTGPAGRLEGRYHPAKQKNAPIAMILHPHPQFHGTMNHQIVYQCYYAFVHRGFSVLRFNFRGVSSPRGSSGGSFGEGVDEKHDLAAAMDLVVARRLPHPWLVGWSFGTEVVLKYGLEHPIDGAILLSPPLHRATDAEISAWANSGKRLVAVIPELDDYLRPTEARQRFAVVPEIDLVVVEGGKHLWVGESQTRRVLTEVVQRLNPAALPLPTSWPMAPRG